MVIALVGTNWYGLKKTLDEHIKQFRSEHGDMAIEKIYAPESTYNEISGALGSVSLFVSTKMIVITDLSGNKEVAEKINDLIQMVDDQTTLIIVETNVDKRSAYYKTLKKLDNFKEFGELNEVQLQAWIEDYVKSAGGEINRSDASYLIERIGLNQTMIERELAKLLQYDSNITKASIEDLTDQTPVSTIFNLVDTVFSGNLNRALKLYDEQRALRVEPQAIYGMLVWQMHIVTICSAAGSKSSHEIAQETGVNSYVAGKAQTIAQRMGAAKIQNFLKLLRDIEITSKSQTYDLDDALKYAITSLAF